MKNKALLAAALLTALVITSLLSAVFADEEKAEKIVRIESGQTLWRYRVTTTSDFDEFDSEWYRVGYDASAWSEGVSPFGDRLAGGTDAGWEGEKHALFLITTFWVEESHPAQELSLFADIFYDNTMTVYLNGAPIFFDDGWVDSETTLTLSSETLVSGANTLAISLLDNMGGREFDMTLYTLPRHAAPPIPPVTTERAETSTLAVSDEALTAAGLPIVRIDTEDGDYVTSRIDYVDAVMQIDPGSRYPEEAHLYTAPKGAAIEIRGRGNSTWNNGYRDGKPNTLPGDTHTRKVPYNIKLEEKVSLFGMVKSKKWVLLANYMDRSNLRNKLIFDLSGQMGMYSTRSVFVNLVLNGEYMGVYMLCEKVDIDLFGGIVTDFEDYAEDFAKAVANDYGYDKAWRSAFEEELCENLSWLTEETYKGYRVADYVDLSGVSTKTGFLLEYDGYADEDSFFITEHGVPLKVSNLEYIKSNPTVFNGLKAYISEFEEALFSDTFYNRCGKHYSEYLDMEAFVDYFLLNTLILNVEFGYKSMYMVLNPDGKLVLGPCWDYDWSSGNPFLGANGEWDKWYNDGRAANNVWYREVYGDPWFVALAKERWASLSQAVDDMIASMAAYEAYLLPSTEWEYRKFAADSYESDFAHRTGGRSFAEEVEQLRLFLEKRAAWMDEQLAKRDPDVEGFGMKVTEEIRLTLSGDTVRADSSGFDYRAESGSVFLQIRAPWADIEVYLNGKAVTAQSETSGQTWLVTADPAAFDKGCNVWTVYAYENGEVAGINYLSLVLEGEKREAPEKGSALPPDAAEAEPSVYELSSASLDAFVQIAKGGEYDALRLVFVADQAYLYAYESLLVHAVFTTVSGEKRCLEGRLAAADGDYALYRTVTADGALYRAASGDLLFGNVIREIPHGLLASLSVTVSDTEGHILYSASEKVS